MAADTPGTEKTGSAVLTSSSPVGNHEGGVYVQQFSGPDGDFYYFGADGYGGSEVPVSEAFFRAFVAEFGEDNP